MTVSAEKNPIPLSVLDGSFGFRSRSRKKVLGVQFDKHTQFTFRDMGDHYSLRTSTYYYRILRVVEEYEFSKENTQVEGWMDTRMVEHLKFTVLVEGRVETLELIRG